jgi:hypothetical protein
MKLTELQYYLLNEAHENAARVLTAMKLKSLKGDDLKTMKALEAAVQNIEFIKLSVQVPL